MVDVIGAGRVPLEGNLIPAFELPRAGGGTVRVRAYRGRRSLALYFLHGGGCVACGDIASEVLSRYGDYGLADAEPLLIVPGPMEDAEALRHGRALPFPVLADTEGRVARRYGDPGMALLVSDRFGAPVRWQVTGAEHDLPDQDVVLREVEYLSHTCSAGCATPIWPEER
jgi:peroxiredoxin